MKQNLLLKTAVYLCLLSLLSNVASAQCETINGSTNWTQHNNNYGGSANKIIYDDGTNIRLAGKTSPFPRTTSSTYNTIVKSTEGVNLSNQISTISVIYKPGAAAQNDNGFALGWAFNPAFPGAGSNQVNPGGATTYNSYWLANIYINGTSLGRNSASVGASGSIPDYIPTYGDAIEASLVSQPDGTAALHVVVTRNVSGVNTTVLDFYDFNAVTAANVTRSIANPVYPVLNIVNGSTNLACLQTERTNYVPTPKLSGCTDDPINGSTDWQQGNNGGNAANAIIYDDGTNIRLANVINTANRHNNYPNNNVIVKTTAPADLNKTTSTITAIMKTPEGGLWDHNIWTIGWTANKNFKGIAANNINHPSYAIDYNIRWSANIALSKTGFTMNAYSSYLESVGGQSGGFVAYTPMNGDEVTASLEPQPDGTAAMHVVVMRGGKEVVNAYDFVAIDAVGVDHGPVYPALQISNSNVNLGCLSAKTNTPISLPAPVGSISAFIQNGLLQINWQTLTEKNNDHFEIEVSKDGKTWSKAGSNINSKATGGNSDISISYQQSIPLSGMAVMGVSMFLLSMGMMFRRNKWLGSVLMIIGMSAVLYGCTKNDSDISSTAEKVFVRIKQVDKDGTATYSKVVTAVIK